MKFGNGKKLSIVEEVAMDFQATLSRTERAAIESLAASMNLTRNEISLIFSYEKMKADVLQEQFDWRQIKLQDKWDREHPESKHS